MCGRTLVQAKPNKTAPGQKYPQNTAKNNMKLPFITFILKIYFEIIVFFPLPSLSAHPLFSLLFSGCEVNLT